MAEEDVWSGEDTGKGYLQLPGVGVLSDLRDKWAPKATQDTCLIGRMCRKHGPYSFIKRPDLTKLIYQCVATRYWTIHFAVVCKRCKSMSWLFEGVQNWFALLKMEEHSSSCAGRVLSKIAAFSPLKCCPHIWIQQYFLPLGFSLCNIKNNLQPAYKGAAA